MIKISGTYDAKNVATMKRLIVSAWGDDKMGKTHFALTAPGPILYFNFDSGLEGVIEKFREHKEIIICDLQFSSEQADAVAKWGKFMKVYEEGLLCPDLRTIIVDTGTQAWELMRLKHFGKLSGVIERKYEKPNAEFQTWMDKAFKYNKNLIILHKSGKEYINDRFTGGQAIKCFNNVGGTVQVNIELKRDGKGGPFKFVVENSRHNPSAVGEEMLEPFCEFKYMASLITGGSVSDWE